MALVGMCRRRAADLPRPHVSGYGYAHAGADLGCAPVTCPAVHNKG